MATVDKYGYVRLREDAHYYSVTHTLIGKKLKISYTTTTTDVEVFNGYECVAAHTRNRAPFRHTCCPEHLCPKHRALMEWEPEKFIEQAASIHEDVESYIRKVLDSKHHIDQANKICSGILNLARKVGGDRLSAACRLAESYGNYGFLEIQNILNSKSEQFNVQEETINIPEHENIRGREYYK